MPKLSEDSKDVNITSQLLIILATRCRDDGIGILGIGSNLSDPAIVTDQRTTQLQCLRHVEILLIKLQRERF